MISALIIYLASKEMGERKKGEKRKNKAKKRALFTLFCNNKGAKKLARR